MIIRIQDTYYSVEEIFTGGYLPLLRLDDGTEWYVAESSSVAGAKAEEYWRDLAQDDPAEFRCILGDELVEELGFTPTVAYRHN